METKMLVMLTAKEATELLVPAAEKMVNADGRFGKLSDASAKDQGGLATEVTMVFDTEPKA